MLSSLMFPLFYIGLVFLCVALTVLSVQQLSDSVKYKFRYRVLSQIGYSRREIRRMIFKQLAGYYLCPACVALAISGLVCVYTGGKFDFYTGVQAAPATYFLISSALFSEFIWCILSLPILDSAGMWKSGGKKGMGRK